MRGSIVKYGKRATLYAVVYYEPDPANPCGRRQRWRRGFRTRKDAGRFLSETITKIEKGTYVPPRQDTLGEYLEQWLEFKKSANRAPKTLEGYANIIYNHLIPERGIVTHNSKVALPQGHRQ